jgi:flagellar hook-length control protein FliK
MFRRSRRHASSQNRLHRMSPSLPVAIPAGPAIGPIAPARDARVGARSADESASFATVLSEIEANEMPPTPASAPINKGSEAILPPSDADADVDTGDSPDGRADAADAIAASAEVPALPLTVPPSPTLAALPAPVPEGLFAADAGTDSLPRTAPPEAIPKSPPPAPAGPSAASGAGTGLAAPLLPAASNGAGVQASASAHPDSEATAGKAGLKTTPDGPLALQPDRPGIVVPAASGQSGDLATLSRVRADFTKPAGVAATPDETLPVQSGVSRPGVPSGTDPLREVARPSPVVLQPVRSTKATQPGEPGPAAGPARTGTNDASESDGEGAPVPLASPPSSAPVRVRDVIDRATAREAGNAALPDAGSPTSGAARSIPQAATPPVAAGPVPSPVETTRSQPAMPAVLEEPAAVPTAPGQATASEARAAETTQQTSAPALPSRVAVETTAQIAAQIVRKLEGRSTRFEMALTPEGLGRVEISLSIEADGALRASLAFDNPAAATDLRGRADELRRQLLDAGFTLADDALSFAERDPAAGHGGGFDRQSDPRNSRAFGAASRLTAEAELTVQPPGWVSLSLTPAGVDMKV